MPRFGLSVATWAGVIGYAKTLSLEVAADRITVNTICPGRIATGRLAKVFGAGRAKAADEDAEMLARIKKEIPMRRVGDAARDRRARRLARFALVGAYITGATFHVDGGRAREPDMNSLDRSNPPNPSPGTRARSTSSSCSATIRRRPITFTTRIACRATSCARCRKSASWRR